jgi:hypothetical protein
MAWNYDRDDEDLRRLLKHADGDLKQLIGHARRIRASPSRSRGQPRIPFDDEFLSHIRDFLSGSIQQQMLARTVLAALQGRGLEKFIRTMQKSHKENAANKDLPPDVRAEWGPRRLGKNRKAFRGRLARKLKDIENK